MTTLKDIEKILKNHERRLTALEKDDHKSTKSKIKIKLGSVTNLLLELREDNFFKSPKDFDEIKKELDKRGHFFNRTSLSKPLLLLIRKKQLGRIGQKGHWKYVSR